MGSLGSDATLSPSVGVSLARLQRLFGPQCVHLQNGDDDKRVYVTVLSSGLVPDKNNSL